MDNPYRSPSESAGEPEPPAPPGRDRGRPTAVTVFAVLNITFGLLGLLCSPFALLALFVSPPQGAQPNPALELLKDPGYRMVVVVSVAVGMVASAALIAAGIGLLGLRPWARRLSIGYACYGIVASISGLVVNYVYTIRPALDAARAEPNPQATIAIFSGVIGSVVSMIFPIVLLVFMTRPGIATAFARVPAGGEESGGGLR